MAVILGIDDGGGLRRKTGQILAERHAADVDGRVEEGFQRDRGGDLAGADQVARDLIDLGMDRLEEMFRVEEIRDAIEGFVIDQDGSQQALLRLDVVRCGTKEWSRFYGLLPGSRIKWGHGSLCLPGNCGIARAFAKTGSAMRTCPQFTWLN